MAGLGTRTWSTGDTVSAVNFQGYLQDQVIAVFATTSARDTAMSSPSDGQFAYVTAGTGALYYYDNGAWNVSELAGDITEVIAGTLLDGGGTAGAVTLNVDLSEAPTSTVDGDGDFFIVVESGGTQHKLTKGNILLSGFNNDSGFASGTITSIVTGTDSGLAGGASSGASTMSLSATNLASTTAVATDYVVLEDVSASNGTRKALVSDITALVPAADPSSATSILATQVFS
jgi:hypothetical protein